MSIIKTYTESLQAIYDHVGFVEDWTTYPISDYTKYYWYKGDYSVLFASSKDCVNEESDNHYLEDIHTDRFYKKWIYRGTEFTMIFLDTETDGMKYFAIFRNDMEVKDLEKLNN